MIRRKDVTIRDADRNDIEGILALLQRTFNRSADSMAVLRDLIAADQDLNVFSFRMLEHEGRLAGVVKTELHELCFGRARLRCGDVGHVAVEPALQGQGLGTMLMEDNSQTLKDHGFHIGRLGGLASFYTRFGWSRLCNRTWRFKLCDIKTGMKVTQLGDLLEVAPEHQNKIRVMDKQRDWQKCVRVCEACHAASYWYEPLDSPFAELQRRRSKDFEIARWVYIDNEQITAYAMVANDEHMFDAAWLPGSIDDFVILLRHVLGVIYRRGSDISEIRASLPCSQELKQAMIQSNLQFELAEVHGSLGSTMAKVVDLRSSLEAFGPELRSRAAGLGQSMPAKFVVELLDRDQRTGIILPEATLVDDPLEPDVLTFPMSQADFISLLMGAALPSRLGIRPRPEHPEALRIADTLFAPQNTVGP